MAKITYDYYDGKDIYNDGDVEAELLNHYRNGKKIDYFTSGIWYLTTDIRANILAWYPFKKTDSILEIGGGSGTLTSVLCEKGGKVMSVEGSKRRAEIIYEKNKEYKNLEVIAGNYGQIPLNGKYDYIVLVGVFEYAKRFFPDKDSFLFFLKSMKRNLKKDGKILIAIENRYGIKYWAGAKEDHLLKSYIGLEGYESTDIGTFGKEEFVNLIKKVGFSKYKFYYPFPDYKLPEIIYSDSRLPELGEVMKIPIYLYDSTSQFEIYSVLKGLQSNDIINFFSNSYIIEFGLDDCILSDIDFVKYQNERNSEYKISTIIQGDSVIKKGMSSFAKQHLRNHMKIHKLARKNSLKISTLREKQGYVVCDYIQGKAFSTHIGELLLENKFEDIIKEIDKLYIFLKDFCVQKTFSNPILPGLMRVYKNKTYIPKLSLMDFNSSNILVDKQNYVLIDQEWLSDKEIPLDYLMSNSLSDIYRCNPALSLFKDIYFFLDRYGITQTKIKIFKKISDKFFLKDNKVIDLKTKSILDGCKYTINKNTNNQRLNDFVHILENLTSSYETELVQNKMSDCISSLCSFVSLLREHEIEKHFYFSNQTDDSLYLPNSYVSKDKGRILLMIHELSRTGAPVVLADTAKILYDAGYFVTVLSLVDGPLKEELLDYGIPVIISEEMHKVQFQDYKKNSENILLDRLVCSYDKVLMCTATLVNFVRRYNGNDKEIYWWLHEGPESWQAIGHLMPKKMKSNIKILCGGQYVIDQLRKYGLEYKCSILNYGVEDKRSKNINGEIKKDKVKFLLVGTICERKGQAVLLEAIQLLPEKYRKKTEFTFVGSTRDNRGEEILSDLKKYSNSDKNIKLIDDIPRGDLYDLYRLSDVLVVPSFDDPMPVVATENFMFGNICICSSMTGTSYYIEDGVNGFVFEVGNPVELSEKIIKIIDNFSKTKEIRQNSRQIYDNNFSIEKFKENLLKIIDNT